LRLDTQYLGRQLQAEAGEVESCRWRGLLKNRTETRKNHSWWPQDELRESLFYAQKNHECCRNRVMAANEMSSGGFNLLKNAVVDDAEAGLKGLMFGQWAEVQGMIDLRRIVDSLMLGGPDSSFATQPQNAWLKPGIPLSRRACVHVDVATQGRQMEAEAGIGVSPAVKGVDAAAVSKSSYLGGATRSRAGDHDVEALRHAASDPQCVRV
jgi:hypothetical protein